MENEPDHYTTIIALTGKDPKKLHILANLSPTVSDPESIWSVVAEFGHHKNEIEWNAVYEIESWLTSMDATPAGKLFAVSIEGELHYLKKGAWKTMDLHCPDGLNAIWAASDQVLVAVGAKGRRVIIKDMVARVTHDKKERELNAVHGTTENFYAAGDEGALFHYQQGVWKEIESPTNAAFFSVLCQGEDVYLAGSGGTVFRFRDDVWDEFHLPKDVTVTSLAWHEGVLYAAGGEDGLFRLNPKGFKCISKLIVHELKVVGDLLFAFGNNLVIQHDGSKWWAGEVGI